MGLSTTAAYSILFVASLLMLGSVVNSLIVSYYAVNQGFQNRQEIIESVKNTISIERIVYNETQLEIFAENQGPQTLEMDKISVVINGTLSTSTSQGNFWFSGERKEIFIATTYDFGDNHDIQFTMAAGEDIVATAAWDKVYTINATTLFAYNYSGEKAWSIAISSPLDLAACNYVFVLNSTEILKYDTSGNYLGSFARNWSLKAIDAFNNTIYAVSTSTLSIMDYNGNPLKNISLTNGKDVCVGKYLYVLDGNVIKKFDLQGNYIGSITDSRLTDPLKIASDYYLPDTLLVLNGGNEILVYRNGVYKDTIPLEKSYQNIELHGKIYLSGTGIDAMNIGYRVKIVDQYGNEAYDYL